MAYLGNTVRYVLLGLVSKVKNKRDNCVGEYETFGDIALHFEIGNHEC